MKKQSSRRQPSPRQLRAVQTSRHLRVTHHKHTGHRLPGRTTSYPLLAMIVLCVGVFLMSWTRFVTASDYQVNARVPGPAPTQAATIDNPIGGTHFTSQPIDVSGTCPSSTYVSLYRNGKFSGVALCQADNKYSLQTGLFVGNNELQVYVFSLTDVPGPVSNSVNVVYSLPLQPDPTPQPSQPGSTAAPAPTSNSGSSARGGTGQTPADPLVFKTDFKYTGQYTGKNNTWRLDISGGNPPYAISVDWGDGSTSLISRPSAGVFSVDHVYKAAGAYKGSYIVKFKASDASGAQAFLQLLTIVNDPPSATGVTTKSDLFGGGSDSAPTYLQTILRYIWPGYGIVVLMLLSFWLGERREYRNLKPRLKKARHRHA